MVQRVALVSEKVRSELQPLGLPLELVVSDPLQPLPAQTLARIDTAFMSIDIVGQSSGMNYFPELTCFFEQLQAAPGLEWLHICSAGADRPAIKALFAKGVRVSTSAGANASQVSHTALAGMLALARRFPGFFAAQQRHEWRPLKGAQTPPDFNGQTAVVVGMGHVGQEIARLLQAFGVRVIGVRRSATPGPHCERVVGVAELDAVLPQADWLVLACPITPETRGLIDARRLALMPAGACVVNIARGAILHEEALVQALRSGRLGGAYLDVFETEPLPADSVLWDVPGLLISPHSAGAALGFHQRARDIFVENLQALSRGAALRNEIRAGGL